MPSFLFCLISAKINERNWLKQIITFCIFQEVKRTQTLAEATSLDLYCINRIDVFICADRNAALLYHSLPFLCYEDKITSRFSFVVISFRLNIFLNEMNCECKDLDGQFLSKNLYRYNYDLHYVDKEIVKNDKQLTKQHTE